MSSTEIGQKLVQHCRDHTEADALETLYAENAVSVEPMTMDGSSPVSEGKAAIASKHAWWNENFEVHSGNVEGPFVNGDTFSLIFEMDATDKNSGQRWNGKEIAVYETDGDRIVRESFFMAPMG